jgi:hypothetical protein
MRSRRIGATVQVFVAVGALRVLLTASELSDRRLRHLPSVQKYCGPLMRAVFSPVA